MVNFTIRVIIQSRYWRDKYKHLQQFRWLILLTIVRWLRLFPVAEVVPEPAVGPSKPRKISAAPSALSLFQSLATHIQLHRDCCIIVALMLPSRTSGSGF